jgi:hypothetical protein
MNAIGFISENQEEKMERGSDFARGFRGMQYPKKSMSFIKEDELYGACLILGFRIQTGCIDIEYGVRISFLVRGLCEIAWSIRRPRACSSLDPLFLGLI